MFWISLYANQATVYVLHDVELESYAESRQQTFCRQDDGQGIISIACPKRRLRMARSQHA